MGLFNGKSKTEESMARLAAKLKDLDIMDLIMRDIAAETSRTDNYWMLHSMGYYDNGNRTVVVGADGIMIFNCAINRLTNLDTAIRRGRRAAMLATFSDHQLDRAKALRTDANDAYEELMTQSNISLNYTEYGYEPLSEYLDEKTGMLLDMNETLQVWAQLLLERMEETYPDLCYHDMLRSMHLDDTGHALVAFTYHVPGLVWKSWF